MNTHFRPPGMPYTTQAAEGMSLRLWTVAEIEAMVQAGIIDEDERFELLDGEVVPMSPKGSTVLLAVEVADSSLRYDTGRKALAYAMHGVKELWVIEAKSLKTHVFKKPTKKGYGSVSVLKPSEKLTPSFAPEIALAMKDLPLI